MMRTITANDIVLEFNSAQPIKAHLVETEAGTSITCVDRYDPKVTHGILIPIDNESRVGVARELANVAGWPFKHMSRLSPPNPERSEDARDGRSAESRCSTAGVV